MQHNIRYYLYKVLQSNRYISFVWKINPIKERYQVYTFDKSVSFKSFFSFFSIFFIVLAFKVYSNTLYTTDTATTIHQNYWDDSNDPA